MLTCPHCQTPLNMEGPVRGYEKLSRRRRELIDCLMLTPGGLFSADAIVNYIYADDREATAEKKRQTIRPMVNRINHLLGYKAILNVYGHGYKLNLDATGLRATINEPKQREIKCN